MIAALAAAMLGLVLAIPVPLASLPTDAASAGDVTRGEYLTRIGDCAACHTAIGGEPFAGGLAIETPFGVIWSPNITPDPDTGIGRWNDGEFVRALQYGIRNDGKRLYPAMPYPEFSKVSTEDVLAIRAYLRTLPPVVRRNRPVEFPFPLNLRVLMRAWDLLFFHPGRFRPDPKLDDVQNRGAYLVQGLAHCGACHTPRNFLGASKQREFLHGARYANWYALDLTPDPASGLGRIASQQIVALLHEGRTSLTSVTGQMPEVVHYSTQHLSGADVAAITAYLKTLPAAHADGPSGFDAMAPAFNAARSADAMTLGRQIYLDNCDACHQSSGRGVADVFASLAGNPAVLAPDPTQLIHVVLTGASQLPTKSRPSAFTMPEFDARLSDVQIAAVLSFVRNSWGNHASDVSAHDVAKLRSRIARAPRSRTDPKDWASTQQALYGREPSD